MILFIAFVGAIISSADFAKSCGVDLSRLAWDETVQFVLWDIVRLSSAAHHTRGLGIQPG
jgi:hypothetical protein